MSDEKQLQQQVFEAWLKRFNPERYDIARGFGIEEWSFVLSRRRFVFDMRGYRDSHDELTGVKSVVLETPLLTKGRHEEATFAPSVGDIACYTAWGMRGAISEHAKEVAAACEAEDDGPDPFHSKHERESEEWWKELMEHSRAKNDDANVHLGSYNAVAAEGFRDTMAYVEVDLSAPDAVILEDFRRWLADIRKDKRFDHSPVSRFTEKELARWVSNRVLPYIDLMLMARALDVPLTHHFAGSVIFPLRDFDPAEKIRKTVAPMAAELLGYEMLEALQRTANALRRSRKEI
jgi:hypothetical protein